MDSSPSIKWWQGDCNSPQSFKHITGTSSSSSAVIRSTPQNTNFVNNTREIPETGLMEVTSTLVFITRLGVCNVKCTVNYKNVPTGFYNREGQHFQNGNKQLKLIGEFCQKYTCECFNSFKSLPTYLNNNIIYKGSN